MYMDNDNAGLLICPMRDKDCSGAQCAAWRWKPELNPDWRPKHDMLMVEAGHDYRKDPPPYIDSKTHGYCGMATRPNIQ